MKVNGFPLARPYDLARLWKWPFIDWNRLIITVTAAAVARCVFSLLFWFQSCLHFSTISHPFEALSFNDKLDRKIVATIYSNCVVADGSWKNISFSRKSIMRTNITSDRFWNPSSVWAPIGNALFFHLSSLTMFFHSHVININRHTQCARWHTNKPTQTTNDNGKKSKSIFGWLKFLLFHDPNVDRRRTQRKESFFFHSKWPFFELKKCVVPFNWWLLGVSLSLLPFVAFRLSSRPV